MSVIAYDGKIIAADRQDVDGSLRITMPKLFNINNYAVGCVGTLETGQLLMNWFKDGCNEDDWPESVADGEWDGTVMIVAGCNQVRYYLQYPVYGIVYDPFRAWGSGRDFAIMAMAMGADAIKAVEKTCEYDVNCGCGIDSFNCAKLARL